jgi:coenzyme F420 hydrogenase subunit beta
MKENSTIDKIVTNNLCHGCGTCSGICPNSAIELIKVEKKGIYLPTIDKSKCLKCGLCYKVCPGHELPLGKISSNLFSQGTDNNLLGRYLNCYSGFSSDKEIRFHSSSGGLVTALLDYMLERKIIDGALVTRMSRNKPLEPEPFIARTKQEITDACGSKYCPVHLNTALKTILETDGKFAVVGLPCHLHGLRKAENLNHKLKEKIVLRIGILCAKTISFNGTLYMLEKCGLNPNDFLSMNYRRDGWPGNMLIELNNHSTVSIPMAKYYTNTFAAFAPYRCKLCIDHAAELSDISLGDAWLPEIKMNDKIGTSIIITRSAKAEEILKNASNDHFVIFNPMNLNKIIQSQSGFTEKKKRAIARIVLFKVCRRKIPDYDVKYCIYSPIYYCIAVFDYFKGILATNRNTRWLLEVYYNLLSNFEKLLLKLKNLLAFK